MNVVCVQKNTAHSKTAKTAQKEQILEPSPGVAVHLEISVLMVLCIDVLVALRPIARNLLLVRSKVITLYIIVVCLE